MHKYIVSVKQDVFQQCPTREQMWSILDMDQDPLKQTPRPWRRTSWYHRKVKMHANIPRWWDANSLFSAQPPQNLIPIASFPNPGAYSSLAEFLPLSGTDPSAMYFPKKRGRKPLADKGKKRRKRNRPGSHVKRAKTAYFFFLDVFRKNYVKDGDQIPRVSILQCSYFFANAQIFLISLFPISIFVNSENVKIVTINL